MTIKRTSPPPRMPSLPPEPPLKFIALEVIRKTKLRTGKGLSVTGAQFKEYKKSYRDRLARAGEGTKADLWVKGGMIASLTIKEMKPKAANPSVIVGPGSKKPRYRLGKGKVENTGKEGKLDYAQIGYVHQHGSTDGRVIARPWLGLTTKEQKTLARKILKKGFVIMRAGSGRVGLTTTPPTPKK